MSKPVHFTLTLATLAISLALLFWGFIPPGRSIRSQVLQPAQMQLPSAGNVWMGESHLSHLHHIAAHPISVQARRFVYLL